MKLWILAFLSASLCDGKTVLITGATGHTGSMVYSSLKANGMTVRALVRDVAKAKTILNCTSCDESEGIFVGDITKPDTLKTAMTGADTLVITTGPAYHCKIPSVYIGCKYYPGADPKTISWQGVKSQVSSFAASAGAALADRHVVLLSNDLTTQPDNFLDKVDNGHGCFYALNGEAFTMSSGVPFTIIKPNGLSDGDAGKKEIIVAHDDEGWSPSNLNTAFISRADVARLATYAALNPEKSRGLRFDVTSKKIGGTPTADVSKLFDEARYPWYSKTHLTVV